MALNGACVLITRCGSSCTGHLPIVRAKNVPRSKPQETLVMPCLT